MPTIKTVSVTYGRKFNLGDYNSAYVELSIWADVTEEEDMDATMRQLWTMAKDNVKAQALPLVNNDKAEIKQIFMGLPVEVQAQLTEPEDNDANHRTD